MRVYGAWIKDIAFFVQKHITPCAKCHSFLLVRDKPPRCARICETSLLCEGVIIVLVVVLVLAVAVAVVVVVVLHVPRSSAWLTPVGGAHAMKTQVS